MFFTRQEALARHDGNTRTRARDDMDMERLLKVFVVTKHLVIWYDIGIIVILVFNGMVYFLSKQTHYSQC